MKNYYTARELAGLPGMPSAKKSVIARAKRKDWTYKEVSASGGRHREYSFASLPSETRQHLENQAIETIVTAISSGSKAVDQMIDIEISSLPSLTKLKEWQVKTMDARMIFMRLIEK